MKYLSIIVPIRKGNDVSTLLKSLDENTQLRGDYRR